ncbi:MAG: DEAD/DEAH box helicase family protein [Methylococcaceae bacterium]|nr:DEAD/DEAH box helicase family protein [Methylococcaceae bacterium]
MELKDYQDRVIDNLAGYLAELEVNPHLRKAFKAYWDEKGVTGMEPYKNNVPGVPHVCAKVPTAGGKTFIAVNAIKTILDAFAVYHPERSKLVIWLVPSLTILEQTVRNLADPEHPYRQRLNQLFRNRVVVYEKRDLLMGAGFSADAVSEQLSIVVMSFDSLRAKNKEDRKIYQDNGYLASFLANDTNESESLLPEYDPSALINVIRRLKPVVIVDESHNAETALSVEMLINLNPHFIFDLTATPRNNSNIISYVDAMALKKQHMVKLPVIVANRSSRGEAIESAIILRRQLEEIAIQEEAKGGKYIRPIVLFQAQPRTGEDNTTYEKTKQKLIELGIPEQQIKIKTADINELKGIDLMSRECTVRYIITVNALKEGWDCPFAYILASLADKSSAVDVEQILGRILRMPHVQQHGHDLLNLSYVFTASSLFMDTLQSVVKALNRAGFSDKDYRDITPQHDQQDQPTDHTQPETNDLFGMFQDQSDQSNNLSPEKSGSSNLDDLDAIGKEYLLATHVGTDGVKEESCSQVFVDQVTQQAIVQNKNYEEQAKEAVNADIPADLEDKMNKHKIKDIFRKQAMDMKLPQFFTKVETGAWFDDDDAVQIFERELLLKDFKLSQADASISFEDVETEMYRVDLEEIGDENYKATPFKVNVNDRRKFNALILKGDRSSQVMNLTARLADLIGNMYPITDQEIKKYIGRIVESFSESQIRDCLERDVSYIRKIKQKITTLADAHAYKTFIDILDIDKILIQPSFGFSEIITPSSNAPALPKSLYGTEASMGIFESRVINDIANLENIQWWHRNLSRGKGFRINGFINHYPDFIVRTKTGKVIVIETKGDDRDNSDSEFKLKLGKLWEAKCGSEFKYMMIFDNNPVSGAERLSDAIKKLSLF